MHGAALSVSGVPPINSLSIRCVSAFGEKNIFLFTFKNWIAVVQIISSKERSSEKAEVGRLRKLFDPEQWPANILLSEVILFLVSALALVIFFVLFV